MCLSRMRRCPCLQFGCDFESTDSSALTRHMQECPKWIVNCAYCPRLIPRGKYLSHLNWHNVLSGRLDTTTLSCPCSSTELCDFEGSAAAVSAHLRTSHPIFVLQQDFTSVAAFEEASESFCKSNPHPQEECSSTWKEVITEYGNLLSSNDLVLRDPMTLSAEEIEAERNRLMERFKLRRTEGVPLV